MSLSTLVLLSLKAPISTKFMRQAHYSLMMCVFLKRLFFFSKNKSKCQKKTPTTLSLSFKVTGLMEIISIIEEILNIVLVNQQVIFLHSRTKYLSHLCKDFLFKYICLNSSNLQSLTKKCKLV